MSDRLNEIRERKGRVVDSGWWVLLRESERDWLCARATELEREGEDRVHVGRLEWEAIERSLDRYEGRVSELETALEAARDYRKRVPPRYKFQAERLDAALASVSVPEPAKEEAR